jgi:DNA-binding IclR family transcriptional regulator
MQAGSNTSAFQERETPISHREIIVSTTGQYRIKVLEKALAVLELFDEQGTELTVTEIGERLGIHKTTAFRIVTVLDEANYLEKAHGSMKYRLGFKLLHLGSLVEGGAELKKRARPILEKLKQECDETVHLVILNKGEALYLDKIEGLKTVRVVSRVGMTLPAHCSGVGKVLLAHLPEDRVESIIRAKGLKRFTPNTITERDALRTELRRIRERGYALDNEEIEIGLKCVAAPISDGAGTVIGALSISGPAFRFEGREAQRLTAQALRAAARVSEAMKGSPSSRTAMERRGQHARASGAI